MRAIAFIIACISIYAQNVYAQGRLAIVRDAEIEALMQDYALPIMKVAGMQRNAIDFHIVNNQQFNAFVTGNEMYLYTGLILQSKTPGEVIGVIAHEIGHIRGGHQLRLAEKLQSAQRIAQVSTLLGVGIGAYGVANEDEETASAGFGVVGGGQRIAQRSLLAYQRDEEAAADRAAINYLELAMQSGRGMIETFKRLDEQTSLHQNSNDPYLLSHPLPRERLNNLLDKLGKSPYYDKPDDPILQKKHDMVRVKIAAYISGEKNAKNLVKQKGIGEEAKKYGTAIIEHLYGSPKNAVKIIDELLVSNGNNPYIHEMKGEILLRSGKGAEAAKSFAKAVELDRHNSGFLKIQLGHALLESRKKENIELAIVQLRQGLAIDPDTYVGYQHLARAYGEMGNVPHALLATAELSVRTNRINEAIEYAKRAQEGFKSGSPAWLRAEDIIKINEKKE